MKMLGLPTIHPSLPRLLRRSTLTIIVGLCFVGQSAAVLADTVTNYQLSGVSFTNGTDTWNITGGFTYDNFDIGGSGAESNAVFNITGPSIAFSGTYSQVAAANSSGNGFYALGTRTDGTPPGMPYDVVLNLNSNQLFGAQATSVNGILFVVPGYGNFVGYGGFVSGTNIPEVTGEVVPVVTTPLPSSWIVMLTGLAGLGLGAGKRPKSKGR